MQRRAFLKSAAAATAAATTGRLWGGTSSSSGLRPILLRSGWQAVNIGDIGHTPGAIEIVHRFCPERPIILWPKKGGLDLGAGEFLRRSFPSLSIVQGTLRDGKPDTQELAAAWDEAGFLLHSSGSGFPAQHDVSEWRTSTGKPYGIFPVSTDPVSGITPGHLVEGGTLPELRAACLKLPPNTASHELREVVEHSSFMFCRDTISLAYLQAQKIQAPLLAMGPDTQFGMTLKDTVRGDAYRKTAGLETHRFICVIPRIRYTMHDGPQSYDAVRSRVNDEHILHDMDLLMDVMERYVRSTGNKVLVCPEMTYQIELGRKYLADRFPSDLKSKLVLRNTFWMPDEAAAVYAHASAVVSQECHSPIISLVQETPTFYIRQPTDTCKGQMYPDLGLANWFFEIDKTNSGEIWQRLQGILKNPAAARAKAADTMALVHNKQAVMGKALRDALVEADAANSKA